MKTLGGASAALILASLLSNASIAVSAAVPTTVPTLTFDQSRDVRQARNAFTAVLPEMAPVLYFTSTSTHYRVPIQSSNLALTLSSPSVQESDFRSGALLGRINRATDLAFLKSSVPNITVRIVNTSGPDGPRRVATYGVDNPVFLKLRNVQLLIGPFGQDPTTYDSGWTRRDLKLVLAFMSGPDLHVRLCDGLMCGRSPLGPDEIRERWEHSLGPLGRLTSARDDSAIKSYTYCGAAGAEFHLILYRTALPDTDVSVSAGNRCS